MNPTPDVLVVGLGPVGATAAALFSNAGLSVTAIDRDGDVYALPRAVATDDDALRVWQTIPGLVDEISKNLIRNPGVQYTSSGGRMIAEVEPALRKSPSGHPSLALFHQPTLERSIRAAAERCGAELVTGVELTGWSQSADGVLAEVRDVESGRESEIRARWLIGADGASSAIRKALGGGFSGATFEEPWVVLDAKVDPASEPDRELCEFHCNPERPTVTMPMPGGRRRWEFMFLDGDSEDEMLSEQRIEQMVADSGGARPTEVERALVYTFHARLADHWGEGRVFIMGDAAHLTPPFAGQGMNTGVRDAGNLWWKIAAVEREAASPALLDTYQQEREPHAKAMIALAVRLGGIVQTPKRSVARVRDAFLRAFQTLPGVRTWTRRMGWKPASVIGKGFLKRRRRLPGSAEGTLMPSPVVQSTDGEMPLDDLIGPRFAVISRQPDGLGRIGPEAREIATGFGVVEVTVGEMAHGSTDGEVQRVGIVDASGALDDWLRGRTALVRPDRYLYGTWR